MKILIFSDSHKHCANMAMVISRLRADIGHVLHLGDNLCDAQRMAEQFPGLKFDCVSGNCDFPEQPAEKLIHIGGKRILLAHGHQYGVKYGYQRIMYAAFEAEADACFFGHTHQTDIFYENGVLFLNPGSISLPREPYPSYGVADITDGIIDGGIVTLNNGV